MGAFSTTCMMDNIMGKQTSARYIEIAVKPVMCMVMCNQFKMQLTLQGK